MAIYTGTVPPGPGLVYVTVCFTGWDATLFRWAISNFQAGSTTLLGGVVGFVGSFLLGPEVVPQIGGFIGGAIVGAIIGGALSLYTLLAGKCACPAGADGFCVAFIFLVVPGTPIMTPIWPFIIPDGAGCTTVMPAGCP